MPFNNKLRKCVLSLFPSREITFAFFSRGSSESKRRTLLVYYTCSQRKANYNQEKKNIKIYNENIPLSIFQEK